MSNVWRCEHCGRTWRVRRGSEKTFAGGGWTGFLQSAVNNHGYRCVERTPQERMKVALRDKKKWEKHPPSRTVIVDDFTHPGFATPSLEGAGA